MSRMNLRRVARQKFGPWKKVVDGEAELRYRASGDRRIKWSPGCYTNNRYAVQMSFIETEEFGKVVHLWIRKHLDEPLRSWQDLMRIKNELVGEDRVAVEVRIEKIERVVLDSPVIEPVAGYSPAPSLIEHDTEQQVTNDST